MLPDELGETPAALGAERAAARVLEGGDRVQERDRSVASQLGGERVEVETLLVHRQRDDLGPLPRKDLQRSVVRGALDEHASGTTLELERGVVRESLQAADREEDALWPDAVPRGQELAQRAVAAARAVRENRLSVALEGHGRAVGEERRVETLGRRGAARERDRCHVRSLAVPPPEAVRGRSAGIVATVVVRATSVAQ